MRLSLVLLINRSGAARRGNYNEGKKRPFNDVLKSNRGFEVKIHSQSSVSTINKHHLLFVAKLLSMFSKGFRNEFVCLEKENLQIKLRSRQRFACVVKSNHKIAFLMTMETFLITK